MRKKCSVCRPTQGWIFIHDGINVYSENTERNMYSTLLGSCVSPDVHDDPLMSNQSFKDVSGNPVSVN